MTVCDPVIKEGIKKFVVYKLKFKNSEETIYRRFSDFYLLRSKLVERWPGVYIPNIPHKKAMVQNFNLG